LGGENRKGYFMRQIISWTLIAALLLGFSTLICSSYKTSDELDWSDKEVVGFIGEVDGRMIRAAADIDAASKSGQDIYIIITSPGGDVLTGSVVVSAMEVAKHRGSTIHCLVPVMAASMAMHFFNHCSKRYVFPEAFLLFHEARAVTGPTSRQAKHSAEQLDILTEQLELQLIENLGVNREVYNYHSVNETLFTGVKFQEMFPGFINKIVRDIKLPEAYSKSIYSVN
jgi:ATP-dependent protease ClpP protease subunit